MGMHIVSPAAYVFRRPGDYWKHHCSLAEAYRIRRAVRAWLFRKERRTQVERLEIMDDVRLQRELRRLERDVDDFRARAAAAAAAAERSGRSVISDPLHQRLTSIQEFLGDRLKDGRTIARKRATAASARSRWSLASLFQQAGTRA
jgi:hypothetical protein